MPKTLPFEMTFVYSYLEAPSWPESFPYGVALGVTSRGRLRLGGYLGVHISREYTPDYSSPGRHLSEHAVVFLATADYDLRSLADIDFPPQTDSIIVPFVGLGVGLMTADITIINNGVDDFSSETLGEEVLTVPAVRGGVGFRWSFAPGNRYAAPSSVCLLTRLDYLWAPGKMLQGTPYEFGGDLGGISLSLGLGF